MTDVTVTEKTQEVVLVTGLTGYIATECCKVLADRGWTNIRGTTRSTDRAHKLLKPLFEYCKIYPNCKVELVAADLCDEASIQKAIIAPFTSADGTKLSVTRVLHIASPFPGKPKSSEAVLGPAIEGTRAVMKASSEESSSVKQVIVTSSGYSLHGNHTLKTLQKEGFEVDAQTKKCKLDEGSWGHVPEGGRAKIPKHAAYPCSKVLAEKAAWDFW